MKGQMFLIVGILIVLFMITVRVAVEPAKRITRPNEFDTINIRNEFASVQKYTEDNQTKLKNNIDDFSRFMVDRFGQRKIDFTLLYVSGFINKTDTNVNITVGNYLGSTISSVNVSFGNASGTQGSYLISSLSSNNSYSQNISFSVLVEEKHINVTYTFNNNNYTLFYTFTPKQNYTTIATLYDLNYTILDKVTKDRFVQVDYL